MRTRFVLFVPTCNKYDFCYTWNVDKYSSQQQTGSMEIYTYTYITEHSCRFQVQQHDDSVSALSENCVANKAKNTGNVSKCDPKRKVLQIWYVVSNHQTKYH